jgi:hypothetical protein
VESDLPEESTLAFFMCCGEVLATTPLFMTLNNPTSYEAIRGQMCCNKRANSEHKTINEWVKTVSRQCVCRLTPCIAIDDIICCPLGVPQDLYTSLATVDVYMYGAGLFVMSEL